MPIARWGIVSALLVVPIDRLGPARRVGDRSARGWRLEQQSQRWHEHVASSGNGADGTAHSLSEPPCFIVVFRRRHRASERSG